MDTNKTVTNDYLQSMTKNTLTLSQSNITELAVQTNIASVTIHQLTTMLVTFKNVLFPGHNHLLTTVADDPSL